jgi:hypothetical protein
MQEERGRDETRRFEEGVEEPALVEYRGGARVVDQRRGEREAAPHAEPTHQGVER